MGGDQSYKREKAALCRVECEKFNHPGDGAAELLVLQTERNQVMIQTCPPATRPQGRTRTRETGEVGWDVGGLGNLSPFSSALLEASVLLTSSFTVNRNIM